MVWCFVKSLVFLVIVEYRAYVRFLTEALNVLLVLEYAMTRLITLCPDTKLQQEEDRIAAEGELTGKKLKEELFQVEKEHAFQVGSKYALIRDPSEDKVEKSSVGHASYSDDFSDGHQEVNDLGHHGDSGERGDGPSQDGEGENEVTGKKKSFGGDSGERDERPSQDGEGENEVTGKIYSENEEEEAKESDGEESDKGVEKVTLMMMGMKFDDRKESEERESEMDESMETANNSLPRSSSSSSCSSSSFHSVKEGETEAAGQIGNLIKDLFGEEWGEDDVLNYMSEEEHKENRSSVEIEWISFLHELENRVKGGEQDTEKKEEGGKDTEQRGDDVGDRETGDTDNDEANDIGENESIGDGNDEKRDKMSDDGNKGNAEGDNDAGNKEMMGKKDDDKEMKTGEDERTTEKDRTVNGTLVKSFSLEMVDCDYIDQSESESEEKTVMEMLHCDSSSEKISDSLLDIDQDVSGDKILESGLIFSNVTKKGSIVCGTENEGSQKVNKESVNDESYKIYPKAEKDSMKVDGYLELLLDERSFFGDSKEKKMPKSLQKIHKEEEKLMNWKIYEEKRDSVTDSSVRIEKDDKNKSLINDICKTNAFDDGAKEYTRVSDFKRKRSLSVPSISGSDRKRIASGVGNSSISNDGHKHDPIQTCSNTVDYDYDSVFGDSEDESDDDKCLDVIKKRVKMESFSSTVSNILEEMGPNNSSNDMEYLTDFDEEMFVKEEENSDKNHRELPTENIEVNKLYTDDEISVEVGCNNDIDSKDRFECSKILVKEMNDGNKESLSSANRVTMVDEKNDEDQQFVSPANRVTAINRPTPPDHQKPGTNIKVDLDASLKWIKEFPPPLSGPKCTCKSPGTPPWKLASDLETNQRHDATCKVNLESSSEQEVVSVKLRRSRCASFSPEMTSSPYQKQYSQPETGMFHEEIESLCPKRRSLDGSDCSKEQKDKKRLLRSLSFFSRSSQSNLSVTNVTESTPSPSDAYPNSSPIHGSNSTNLTTPRRWSRVLGCKRRNVQSCIFPNSASFSSTDEKLPSRVKSVPNVTEKWSNKSESESVQRKFSKVWHEKRRAVRSCIFPDPEDEDLMPYGVLEPKHEDKLHKKGQDRFTKSLDFEEAQMTTSHLSIHESECSSRTPESLVRTESFEWNESLSDVRESKLTHSKSEAPLSEIHSLNSQPKKSLSFNQRPKSLIFIPESRVDVSAFEKGPQRASIKRPQSLMIPPDMQIPKRDPSLTPPDPSQTRPRSQSRLSYRDLRILKHQPSSDWRLFYPLLTPSPTSNGRIWERDMSQFQREYRKNVRSWSFSPTPASLPLRVPRNPSEKWPDVTSFEQDHLILQPRKLFGDQSSPGHHSAFDTVIFPWRRGDPNRNSGRSSPAPSSAPSDSVSQSPAPSPYYNQSPVPEESINGSCEVAHDSRQKDSSVWRRSRAGSGGVSRSTRKEKASSSPVFRRASLSHSEWDIRRPWSHVYSEREAAKLSQSVCRLAMTSAEEGVTVEGTRGGEEGPRSLPYMSSSNHSSSEGVFQKFKKSLSLRLAKKGSRSESPSSHSAPVSNCPPEPNPQIESQTLPRRRGSINRDDENKSSFLFGHPLFRSSKERRRARLKDARSSKCNSGDSGDSGIELVTGSGHVTTVDMTSHPAEVDANNYLDPAFVASFADEGSGPRELNPRAVRRTHSDVGGVAGRGSLHYSRQLSTPQPIKLRPAHRLPQHTGSLGKSKSLKRSKASSHLRRSISQPLDLDKAYDTPISTLRKCRSPTNAQIRRQRRPSAGNILNDDNTTSEDEIGMSDSEDFRTDLKRSLEEDEDMIVYAEALWDHVTLDSEELVFKAGDLITVIDSSDKDWWWGRICHRAGWFPAAFVRLLVNQEDHQETSSHDTRTSGPTRKQSISGLSNDQIRTNVINEIISTERDFVKHLRDVVEGYLRQVRKRPDMFNEEKISSIFGNMEALYQFQSNFLKELEMCIDWKDPHKSCIGAAFIRNRERFEIYSEYCNNHPSAVSALQELYQDQKYIHFFEACRLLQEMIDISLDGFLLTPVQKICKYPLQLQELLKYTKADHPDFASVQGALEAMRDVALLVNERKRRMECLEKIASWQITVEGWEGPELLEDSSQLIHQGDVTKGVGGSWTKEMSLFLFDHQLVYCKRDLLKRNTFVYRGRLNLDMCEIVDLPDGKDSSLNINAHNTWKIRSLEKNKWYVFSCKMVSEKLKWMEAFRRERELVAADESAGFVVAEKAKHLAKVAARNQRNRPKRPRSLWFSFGGHKKGRGSGRTQSQIQHHPV